MLPTQSFTTDLNEEATGHHSEHLLCAHYFGRLDVYFPPPLNLIETQQQL